MLENAHIGSDLVNKATGLFLYSLLQNHIENSQRLCAKHQNLLNNIGFLHDLFPNAKFIHVIRDPRSTIYSAVSRRMLKSKFILKQMAEKWYSKNSVINDQCQLLGENICLTVRYEDLVMESEKTLRNIVKFLNLN